MRPRTFISQRMLLMDASHLNLYLVIFNVHNLFISNCCNVGIILTGLLGGSGLLTFLDEPLYM